MHVPKRSKWEAKGHSKYVVCTHSEVVVKVSMGALIAEKQGEMMGRRLATKRVHGRVARAVLEQKKSIVEVGGSDGLRAMRTLKCSMRKLQGFAVKFPTGATAGLTQIAHRDKEVAAALARVGGDGGEREQCPACTGAGVIALIMQCGTVSHRGMRETGC